MGVTTDNFAISGREMLNLGREAFLNRAPPFMGDILWEHIEILQRGRPLAVWGTGVVQGLCYMHV